jgi:hypothetical protein
MCVYYNLMGKNRPCTSGFFFVWLFFVFVLFSYLLGLLFVYYYLCEVELSRHSQKRFASADTKPSGAAAQITERKLGSEKAEKNRKT